MYTNIKKYLGNEWLERQMKATKELNLSKEDSEKIVKGCLNIIDGYISLISKLDGFSKWVNETTTAHDRNLNDLVFELLCFENLLTNSNKLVLKVKNSDGSDVEAVIENNETKTSVDMLNIRNMSTTPKNKVHAIFRKTKNKFVDNDGILFVGCSELQSEFNISNPNIDLSSEISELIKEIYKRFHFHENKRIKALCLVIINFQVHPSDLSNVYINKRFILLPKPLEKGGLSQERLLSLFNVKEIYIL